jgi:hypothetical protein
MTQTVHTYGPPPGVNGMNELTTELPPVAYEGRVARGLRFPVVPSGALVAQVLGAAAAVVGAYLTFGLGVTLLASGVAAVVLGALREAKRI